MEEFSKDIMEEINVAAYFLAKEDIPYDTLCWMLAEKKLLLKT